MTDLINLCIYSVETFGYLIGLIAKKKKNTQPKKDAFSLISHL